MTVTQCTLHSTIGESIPIRLFLAGYELTPTMRDINKKFSVRYYLNLVLVDEEERRYFKQQVGKVWLLLLIVLSSGDSAVEEGRSKDCQKICQIDGWIDRYIIQQLYQGTAVVCACVSLKLFYLLANVIFMAWVGTILKPCSDCMASPAWSSVSNSTNAMSLREGTNRTSCSPGNLQTNNQYQTLADSLFEQHLQHQFIGLCRQIRQE